MATATAPKKSPPKRAGFQVVISRERLQEGLAAVSGAVPTKTTLPILGNILLEATSSGSRAGLRFAATDLDLTIHADLPADVEGDGRVTVPAKRLQAIAKELPPAPVRLGIAKDAVTIDCGRAHMRLHALPADEFPSFPDVRWTGGTVRGDDLHDLVKRTAFAVSTEESRPILNGILWSRLPGMMRLVATNGHRLAINERPITAGLGEAGEYIVPPKALAQVARVLVSDEELEVGFGENHLGLRSSTAQVVTRLIEGPYPEFEHVIPKDGKHTVIADRLALISGVRRVLPVASDTTHRLVITFEQGTIGLRAQTPDIGDGNDALGARIEGSPITFGMNAKYLLQTLEAIATDEVRIIGKSPERAFIFEPVGETSGRSLYVVMPLRVLD